MTSTENLPPSQRIQRVPLETWKLILDGSIRQPFGQRDETTASDSLRRQRQENAGLAR